MKNLIGVMQGRLLPKYLNKYQAHPIGYWADEFKLASSLNFDCIEFILDFDKANRNPLLTNIGINQILRMKKLNNISIKSVCADYFMCSPIFLKDKEIKKKNLNVLKKLYMNCIKIGVTDIIIPLVDNSSIINSLEKQMSSELFLKEFFATIKDNSINICLETDLPPDKFIHFINRIN